MLFTKKSLALAAVVAMTTALGAGCGKKPEEQKGGAKMTVAIGAEALISDIANIKVTVEDNGGAAPAFPAFDVYLTKAPTGNVWSGNITAIPANPQPTGSNRLFKAVAYDAAFNVKYEGSTVAKVYANETASVSIILQEKVVPPGPTNYAPRITSITATNSFVLPGQKGEFRVSAVDPDNAADPLAYQWAQSCTNGGVMGLATPDSNVTAFTAPAVDSVCTVSIKVSETLNGPLNLSVTTYFTLTVNSNFGDADVLAFPNSYPIVTVQGDFLYNYFGDVVTGGVLQGIGQAGYLRFHALDPDGDNVQFDLSARCGDDPTPAVPGLTGAEFAALPPIGYPYFSAVTYKTTGGVVVPVGQSAFDFNPTFGFGQRDNGTGTMVDVSGYGAPGHSCQFQIVVHDLCTEFDSDPGPLVKLTSNCGNEGTVGGFKTTKVNNVSVTSLTTGFINATAPAKPQRAPVIVRAVSPNQLGGAVPAGPGVETWDPKKYASVEPSPSLTNPKKYLLQAVADDRFESPGEAASSLSVLWSCNVGTVNFTTAPTGLDGGLKSDMEWTAPLSLASDMSCAATFRSTKSNLTTKVTFRFKGSDPCSGAADTTACDDNNPCTTGTTCTAGICGGGSPTVCSGAGSCQVNACNTLTGCYVDNATAGSACGPAGDGNACTQSDACNGSGVCVGSNPVSCSVGQCQQSVTCSPSTGLCDQIVNKTAGVSCSDGDACTQTDTCNGAGVCNGANPVVCGAATQCQTGVTCNPANGTCVGAPKPDNTPCDDGDVCSVGDRCVSGACQKLSNAPDGTACGTDGLSCTNDVCQTGACSHPSVCAAGRYCNEAAGGLCETGVGFTAARRTGLNRVDGLQGNGSTANYLSGTGVFFPAIPVDGVSVLGGGGSDLLIARYNPTTGLPTGTGTWVRAYGDELSQFGKDNTAATTDGTIAAVGTFAAGSKLDECDAVDDGTGTITTTCTGLVSLTNGYTTQADFLLLVDAATGDVKVGSKAIDMGTAGAIVSVAANAAQNLVAVCGYANKLATYRNDGGSATTLAAGSTYTGPGRDAIVAVFGTDGSLKWAKQIAGATGASDEECGAIAIASDGSVFAAGKYGGALNLGTGAFPTLPNLAAVRHLWLAKWDSTGAILASAAFGTTGGVDGTGVALAPAGNVTPTDLELDSASNLVVGGSFTASFPVGSLVAAGTGGSDALVAKFTGALAASWAVRLGSTGSDTNGAVSIATDDNVIAVGSYSGVVGSQPTSGAAVLTAPGTSPNAYVLKLDAGTGATHFPLPPQDGYGDAANQQATDVAAYLDRVQFAGTVTGNLTFSPPAQPPISTGTTQTTYTAFLDLIP